MKTKSLIQPKKRDYYVECLSIDQLEKYYIVNRLKDSASEEMGSYGSRVFAPKFMPLVDEGLVEPIIETDGLYIIFKFKLWSFVDGVFKFSNEMVKNEFEFTCAYVDYRFNNN